MSQEIIVFILKKLNKIIFSSKNNHLKKVILIRALDGRALKIYKLNCLCVRETGAMQTQLTLGESYVDTRQDTSQSWS